MATGTLGLKSKVLLRALIVASRDTRFGPLLTPQADELHRHSDEALLSGRRELADGAAFFGHFQGRLSVEALQGQTVLDLGCGYGGRTVHYALRGRPERIEGLEIIPEMIDRCRRLARQEYADRAHFGLGRAEALPYDARSFDTVLSYDVLEHVDDPARAFSEIARVLRPSGVAWLVFPSYLGARSSHLDYLTRLPALHRIFDLDCAIGVVNEYLSAEPDRYGVGVQPPPRVGPFGRKTLPTLNGMTYRDSRLLIAQAGLAITFERITPTLHPESGIMFVRGTGRVLSTIARAVPLPELLIGSIALGLTPSGRSRRRGEPHMSSWARRRTSAARSS
jgi:SAM-dependent methyltransferase